LLAAGAAAEAAVWSDDDVIWETFDAVIVRSCWDYHLRITEFRAWLERLDASRIPTWNSPDLMLWNSDKRYLLDLAARGVATIPTTIVPREATLDAIVSLVADAAWTRVVLKPAISASGFETHAIDVPFDQPARETVARVVARGAALIQPFAAEIPRDGELSLVFIDAGFSHAAIKRAAAGDFRVQTEHGGRVDSIEPNASIVEQASRALAALPEIPLYARVDGIVRDGAFLLMELELIEPNLFLSHASGAAARFASAILHRVGQS
jgi:glutathione synthase/RimK-type ligase-like ATP-grasp enzyme